MTTKTRPLREVAVLAAGIAGPMTRVHTGRLRYLRHLALAVYLSRAKVEFFAFDEPYLARLKAGDPATESHFVSYFSGLLNIKLRSRMLPPGAVEDIRQETFYRVLVALRAGNLRSAERLGAFVNSVCNNVLLESWREGRKRQDVDVGTIDLPDNKTDLERSLQREQERSRVAEVLARLPERDRKCLYAIFIEERDKDAICREFGVDRNYLRVLLHRAKQSFRDRF